MYGTNRASPSPAKSGTVPLPSFSGSSRASNAPADAVNRSQTPPRQGTRRTRLHRASALSLKPSSHGATSTRPLGSATGSVLGSPFSQTVRHRGRPDGRQTAYDGRDGETEDNWTSLREALLDDEDDGDRNSDTSTLRPAGHSRSLDNARKSTSTASIRSFFTARSSVTSARSVPGSIPDRDTNGLPSLASGILSSSPPQMNGFRDGIEERLDQVHVESQDLSTEARLGHGERSSSKGQLPTLDERQPLLKPLDMPSTSSRGE
jgi:hypothetical protein